MSAGSDGETGQPSLWGRLRESEESLSQTAALSGDGEKARINSNAMGFGECLLRG